MMSNYDVDELDRRLKRHRTEITGVKLENRSFSISNPNGPGK
jgi:hypothetical protein